MIMLKKALPVGIFLVIAFGAAIDLTLAADAADQPATAVTAPVSALSASSTPTYTLAQVAQHSGASSCWTTINGGVYDLTNWIYQHPGGEQAILSICGIDGTAAFEAQHGGQGRPEDELASLKIGNLAQ